MMKEYLVFRLYGPLASWGQAAVGGDRLTGVQPTRSAIVGLLGAALGLKRDNEAALQSLQTSIMIAVKQCVPSSLMRDYHTAQVPSEKKNVVHYTRKSELGEAKLNTVLSSRDYRCDGLWIVAISLAEQSSFNLEQLKNALLKPVYTLSLGRKSCPLAVPLSPQKMGVVSLQKALDTEFPPLTGSEKSDRFWLSANKQITYYWEGEKSEFNQEAILTTQPWDEPVHRGRWQFKQRVLHQLSVVEA